MRPIRVLLVEDDADDVFLFKLAMERTGLPVTLEISRNGLAMTQRIDDPLGADGDMRPDPDVIVLDLNMPILDGFAVLERLKSDDATRAFPVVVLSTTDHPDSIRRAYAAGAAAYFVKPGEFASFVAMLGAILAYWSAAAVPRAA